MNRRRRGLSLFAISAAILVAPASACAGSFAAANTTPIVIPGTMGGATPYPSQIAVSGLTGAVSDVGVGLRGYADAGPTGDVEVALVSPAGRALLLMAGVGSSASNVDLDLSDHAPGRLPGSGALASGSYRPTNLNGTAADFASPGPGTSYGNPGPQGTATFTSAFGGDPPNGNWKLYVVYASDAGSPGIFANGWQLSVATAVPQPIAPPAKKGCRKHNKHKKKRSATAAKKCKPKKRKR